MTNEIQKQYDRLEDVPSIMLRMKEVYAVPDRHVRYAAIKAFFWTKMTEELSVHSHGVKMLSLVEKLEDLKAGLDNDTRSFRPPRRKARVSDAGRGRRARERPSQPLLAPEVLLLLPRRERTKGRLGVLSGRRQMMSACIAKEMGIRRGSVHNSSPIQVLERSRKISKDEMILRLGDGKAVVAETVGSLRLVVSSHIRIDFKDVYFVPNVYGPLSIPARGGFSYFITFTDDHSRYGYIYLMRYKSEAFGRFKECRLEVENQTNRKIKVLRSDRGGEYLRGEFIDYLKENRTLSQWIPPGTPQLNGVAEMRNRTLLDMVRSMMSFTELPLSFWGYALETAAKLLNIAPSKFIGYPKETVGYYFYDPAEQKIFISRNAVFLEKSFPSDSRHDEVLIEESNEGPHRDTTTSFEPTVHTDSVPVLRRSTRESRVPDRYGFVGLTSQLDNNPKTYGEAMSDIDSDKWLEAMKSKMDSMGSNQVWTLVDPPKGARPIGCKWVYKLAMAKSIRILLAIAAWYNYEIWQIDVKMAFLNGFIEEEIFMDQRRVSLLLEKNRRSVISKGDIKAWLSTQFSMKDMGEASYILDIKIYRNRSRRLLGLTQSSYIEKVLKRFKMEHSKRGLLPMRHGIKLSKKQSPKTDEKVKRMSNIPYASAVGSIQYVVQCTRPNVAYALSVTSRYQACAGEAHWGAAIATLASSRTMMMPNPNRVFVFKLNGGVVAWKSFKQDTTADSTTEAEYIAASEAAKETVWMKNYIQELGVVRSIAEPVVIFCDNNGTIPQAKEPRSHHRSKYIFRRYHLLREMVSRGDCKMD
ncbi:UNVERIFIED_CONTAM: Retrovirus-related Pol polyprotein from transposon TNT 1-94 [Sesamum latifolium]|uniref:Retrovirus-related Pol polyprotein from transposon TNT 1-94 n=1 Tax=Sesamum latifolium TaxID=2727402 RepID=A0AAW2XNK5_9LAMI